MIYKIRDKKTGKWIGGERKFWFSEHGLKVFLGKKGRRLEGLARAGCIPAEYEIVEMVPGKAVRAIEYFVEKSSRYKKRKK